MTLRHRVHRVLYVPLDDRPVNLSLPALLAGIVDYEMTTPPRELLGSYHTPGQPEAIVDWLLHQPVQQPDCLVLSLDMLLYGGLVASRMPAVSPEMARESLEALARLRQTFPEAQIYAFSILTRLDFGLSEEDAQRYGDNLHRYVRLAGDRTRREEAGEIARNLPKGLLETYTRVRQRNHELSLAALDQVAAGNLDFLVLGQDDADCQGFHLSEQKALKTRLRKHKLTQRATLYAGADEISGGDRLLGIWPVCSQSPRNTQVLARGGAWASTAMPLPRRIATARQRTGLFIMFFSRASHAGGALIPPTPRERLGGFLVRS